MATHTVSVDEDTARQLLLARAIDEGDPEGKLIGAAERDRIEEEALQEARAQAERPQPLHFLKPRAARMLAVLEQRDPALAGLRRSESWRAWLPWALPVATLLAGAFIDRIDHPQQVNMLSPALLGIVFWNLAMYVLLAAGAFWPGRWRPLADWQRWLAQWPARERRAGRLRSMVRMVFHRHWFAVAGSAETLWWKQLLHLAAAGWAVGLACSVVAGGLVREYRVGWESTLLDPGSVHAILSVLFAPVVALLPFDAFSAADLQRMAFSSQQPAGVAEARRWVWMYVALLGLLVVLPRLLLAAWTAWRGRRLRRRLPLDLGDAYFDELLARVMPVTVTLAIAADEEARAAWGRLLQQVADHPVPDGWGRPFEVIRTARGDVLRAVGADAASAADAEADACVSVDAGDAGPWTRDAAWLARVRNQLPPRRRAGFARIAETVERRNAERFARATESLAHWLLQAARERGEVDSPPAGLRQLVDGAERVAGQRAREAASHAVLERLVAGQAALLADLVRLHGTAPVLALQALPDATQALALQRQIDSPQAGLAGAASGAAMGAGIDLMTGGLTLGAAAALGALIGGTTALAAAQRRNRASPDGQTMVQLSDEQLQALAESAVLLYLAIASRDARLGAAGEAPPTWRSEVIAAVANRRPALATLWSEARTAGEGDALQARMTREVATLVRAVLAAVEPA
jgi:hypothetical protein